MKGMLAQMMGGLLRRGCWLNLGDAGTTWGMLAQPLSSVSGNCDPLCGPALGTSVARFAFWCHTEHMFNVNSSAIIRLLRKSPFDHVDEDDRESTTQEEATSSPAAREERTSSGVPQVTCACVYFQQRVR